MCNCFKPPKRNTQQRQPLRKPKIKPKTRNSPVSKPRKNNK